MTRTLAIVLTSLFPLAVLAADPGQIPQEGIFRPAAEVELKSFLWTKRLIVVFADTSADPRFHEQINLLKDQEPELVDRDIVVLTDTDPDAMSPVRTKLRPRGFQMVLIDKDGGVKLRKPFPWSVREITRSIDKTQMRLREVEERRITQ